MKKLISLTMLCLALVVPSLKAYELPFDLSGFYYSGTAACNIIPDVKNHDVRVSFDTGYMLSSAIGYRFCNNFRVEGEFAYRNNHNRRVKFAQHIVGSSIKRNHHLGGYVETFAGLVNVYYDLPTCWCVKPYVGAGIGYGHTKFDARLKINDVKDHSHEHKNGFAWQMIAGVAYPLCDNIDVAVEYRYFNNEGTYRVDNHNVGVNLKYFF